MTTEIKERLKRKRLRTCIFYKKNWPVPYVVFAFQIPAKVVYPQPEQAVVMCREPIIGEYLQSDIRGTALPYIDFLPLGRTTPGSRSYTKIIRVRINIGHVEVDDNLPEVDENDEAIDKKDRQRIVTDWNLDHQRIVLMERGIVFGIIDAHLTKEYLWIESPLEYPIEFKGGFEST